MDGADGIFAVVTFFLVAAVATTTIVAIAIAVIIFVVVPIVTSCVISVAMRAATFLGVVIFQSAKSLEVLSLFSQVGRTISCTDHGLLPGPWEAVMEDYFGFIVGEFGCKIASIDGRGHPYDQVVQSLQSIVQFCYHPLTWFLNDT